MAADWTPIAPTGTATIDGLLTGARWNASALTFGFPGTGAAYGADYAWAGTAAEPADGFAAFTPEQASAVRDVLADVAEVAAVTFKETTGGEADLRFGRSVAVDRDTAAFAWGYYPGAGAGGDVWFGSSWTASPVAGGFDRLSLIHEIGHALGLKHPFEAMTAFGGSFPAMPAAQDGNTATVMSYDAYPGAGFNLAGAGGHPQTPMQYDVAALQEMYGANFAAHSGNTVYRWDAATGQKFVDGVGQGVAEAGKIYETVWDGGGRDTYDFSGFTRALTLDINPGAWVGLVDPVGGPQAAFGDGHYAPGMVANAFRFHGDARSLVEDAVGGWASDRITGNVGANRLQGGGGADTIAGGAGNDSLVGGSGGDRLDGGAGFDAADYAAAPGAVVANLAAGTGQGGQATADVYVSVEAVLGSAFNDVLTGNDGANMLVGGAGGDRLSGGGGNDTLNGGAGSDVLIGGAGADVFIFGRDGGADRILDFSPDTVGEIVKLGGRVYASASDALAHAVQVGSDVHLATGTGDVAFVNLKLASLAVSDFVIV